MMKQETLTLFDEFERDAGVVIGVLKSSQERIRKWQKDFRKIDPPYIAQRARKDVIEILDSFGPVNDVFPQILIFLKRHIPELERQIQDGYSKINDTIEKIIGKCSCHPVKAPSKLVIPCSDMRTLHYYIDKLKKELRFCVKEAGEERQRQQQPPKHVTASGGGVDGRQGTKKTKDETNGTIEIQLDRFSKGKSKQLLQDLASCPSGVTYNPTQHGKKQPDTLKERLKGTEYKLYRDFFHRKGNRIWCDKKIHLI